ncbi:MAG: DinB family protein [Ilumatobacter sp.]
MTASGGEPSAREVVAEAAHATPEVLATLLAPYPDEALTTRPAEGEWSVHEIIEHLVTGDGPAFRDRVSSIVSGNPSIAAFDPAAVMGRRDPNATPLAQLLDDLRNERSRSSELIRSLSDDELSRTATHRAGEFRAGDFVDEWPFHDHDHLQQILEVLKAWHARSMSATMRRALEID